MRAVAAGEQAEPAPVHLHSPNVLGDFPAVQRVAASSAAVTVCVTLPRQDLSGSFDGV